MLCCRHTMQILQSNSTLKKGCIKNIKYVMLKHYKQEHVHLQHPSITSLFITNNNYIEYIIFHNNSRNFVNAKDSISTISSMSNPNQQNSVALPVPSVDTHEINNLFHQVNHFDSPPNQMYSPEHVTSATQQCTWHIMACS